MQTNHVEIQSSSFQVGKVFGADRSTDLIYKDIVQPLLPWVWKGGIGTLFAYGQTGSGKTYSISGIERLVACTLFDGTLQGQRKLHVSIFELAGNSAFGENTLSTVFKSHCRSLNIPD